MLNTFCICYKTDVIQHGTANLDPRQWASGGQINSLSQQYNVFCGGVKTANFYINMMIQCGQIQIIIAVSFRI